MCCPARNLSGQNFTIQDGRIPRAGYQSAADIHVGCVTRVQSSVLCTRRWIQIARKQTSWDANEVVHVPLGALSGYRWMTFIDVQNGWFSDPAPSYRLRVSVRPSP
jgi:hypothetical protein